MPPEFPIDFGWDSLARLVVAVVLGGLIGLEREAEDKPAGLRTHMLVALGAATFTLATLALYDGLDQSPPGTGDPIRLIQGIVGGIGFLGAGAIIRTGNDVHGLTTAGSIWLAGAIGISAGIGQYTLAAVAVLLALLVLFCLRGFTHRIGNDQRPREPEREVRDAGNSPRA